MACWKGTENVDKLMIHGLQKRVRKRWHINDLWLAEMGPKMFTNLWFIACCRESENVDTLII